MTNLSEKLEKIRMKAVEDQMEWSYLSQFTKDVKEFIKELKEELKKNCLVYPQIIDELAGDRFK